MRAHWRAAVGAALCALLLGMGATADAKQRRARAASRPAHHWGEDCTTCHEGWNLVQMHDAASPQYNDDCILCHGNMRRERTLDRRVPGIHRVMMPLYYRAGQRRPDNAACVRCHASTDFLGASAGNLRRQVEVRKCWGCHQPGGTGKVLYRDRE